MSATPIYRLRSHSVPHKEEEDGPVTGHKSHLCATINIPDSLPPGSTIHLKFPLVSVDGKSPPHDYEGGGFIRICEDGRMEVDET